MKNILIKITICTIILLIVFPFIEYKKAGKLIMLSYSDDISKLEDSLCYDESYMYNKKRDISIYEYDFKKILFFYINIFKYKEGNVCETEYLLEEEYINNVIENSVIKYNEKNINLAKLIKGKKAIVSNTRYLGNDYENSIEYVLDGKHQILYVFYVDDLLIMQVGLSDEGPKYIAYK